MIKLRDYQQEVYDDIRTNLINHRGVCAVLPTRSGKSYIMLEIVKAANKKGSKVLILAHRHLLLDQHKELITTGARIESVFTEVNRLGKNGRVDIIIIDEAHLSGASSYQKVAEYYSNAKIVLFTATPARLDGKPINLATKIIKGTTANELIEMGHVAPYDLYAPDIDLDLSNVKMSGSDFNVVDLEQVMMERKIYGKIIDNYKTLASGKQAIAYCSTVKHSQMVTQLFNDNGISARHMDASTPQKERDKIMTDFKNGKFMILSNCNLISEGITVPNADAVLLLRPTQSLALYIQQSTRCLTPRPDKKAVIIDYVGNCYAHGMPSDDHDWTLDGVIKSKNKAREPELLVRQCNNCYRVYESKLGALCPYCGHDNGKTRQQIKQDKEAELKKIEAIKKRNKKREQGMAQSYDELVQLAKKRGYKNPKGWAYFISKSRRNKKR